MVVIACPSIEILVQLFYNYSKYFLHCESTVLVIIMGNGIIAPGDSLFLDPWHLRVNLDVKDSGVTPSPQKGPRVLRKRYGEHFVNSVACRGDTWGPKLLLLLLLIQTFSILSSQQSIIPEDDGYRQKTKVIARRLSKEVSHPPA